MANPLIQQGTLNRLLASVVYAEAPELSVINAFLGKGAISIAFEGETSQLLPTLTGAVTSPEPYMFATVTMHLVRSQFLAAAYKARIESNTTMGSVNIIPDTLTLPPFQLDTCVLMSLQEMTFDGNQAELIVKLRGVYRINSNAFFSS
jgi:hypothetical protein